MGGLAVTLQASLGLLHWFAVRPPAMFVIPIFIPVRFRRRYRSPINFIPVTLQATDAAGNVGFANGQVQMDLSPPEILSADFSLETYRSGNRVTHPHV